MSNTWLDLLAFQGPTGPTGPAGPAGFTAGGDLSGSSTSQLVVSLTGTGGNLDIDAGAFTVAKGTAHETRSGSDLLQTSSSASQTVSVIPIPQSRTTKIIVSLTADGPASAWEGMVTMLVQRIGTGAPTVQQAAALVATGGLLTGATATAAVSGNNVLVTVSGASGTVNWVSNWTAEDTGAGVPSTAPFVSNVSPNHGAQDGSTSVSVFGGNFDSDAVVYFDGVLADAIAWQNDGRIDCDPPAHGGGIVNVLVRNVGTGEDSGASGNGAYTYDTADFDPTTFGGGTLTFYCRGDTVHVAGGKVDDTLNGGSNGDSFTNAGGGSGAQPTFNASGSANSKPSWTFDGSNDILMSSTAFANFFTSSTGTLLVVFNCATWPATDSATSYLNAGIIVTQGGYFGIYARLAGGTTPTIVGGAYDGADKYVGISGTPVAANKPVLATLTLNGGNLTLQVNNGTPSSVACGSLAPGASPLNMGAGYGGAPTAVEEMTVIAYSSGSVASLATLQSEIMAFYGIT